MEQNFSLTHSWNQFTEQRLFSIQYNTHFLKYVYHTMWLGVVFHVCLNSLITTLAVITRERVWHKLTMEKIHLQSKRNMLAAALRWNFEGKTSLLLLRVTLLTVSLLFVDKFIPSIQLQQYAGNQINHKDRIYAFP